MTSLPSIVLQKKSIAESHLFLFSFPCFYFHFSSFFFFAPYVLPRRSDGRGQDTSPREMIESSGGNGHQDLKRRSLVGVIWAWLKVWVDGPESTKENASVFCLCKVWQQWCVSCDWVTQTARGTAACEGLSSYPGKFLSLCLFFLSSLCLPSSLETWQKVRGKIGQPVAVKLNPEDQMVCGEDPRKIVPEKP